jgi:hypothetical protein
MRSRMWAIKMAMSRYNSNRLFAIRVAGLLS